MLLGLNITTVLHGPFATSHHIAAAVQGFNITAGGGLGRTHRNEDTFARMADPLGYVDKDDLFHVVSAKQC